MTRLLLGTILGVCTLVFMAACANKGPFRMVNKQNACFPNLGADPVPSGDGQKRSASSVDCAIESFAVGFVEFTPAGTLVDLKQAEKALKLIEDRKKAAPGGKVITLVYVHGWKNNASRAERGGKPKDVEKFKTALLDLGYRAARAANGAADKPVPVVGIYIGWPGKSLMGPSWFTFFSYWSRRGTANKVGDGEHLGPLLNDVIAETRKDSPNSRVLLVGHSFGARVLEHAIVNRQVKLYDTNATGPIDPLVDLVLYVNSANDARLSVSRVVELQKKPLTLRHPDYDASECKSPKAALLAKCRDYPLQVAITSRGDQATKRLQPIANFFSDGSPKLSPLGLEDKYADRPPSEGAFGRGAAAHMPFLQSHAVARITCPAVPNDRPAPVDRGTIAQAIDDAVKKAVNEVLGKQKTPEEEKAEEEARQRQGEQELEEARLRELAVRPECGEDDRDCRFAFKTRHEPALCFKVAERGTVNNKPAFNKTAFWIMDVDPVVMADHGDIWNLSFVEMLGQLMAPRGFFEPGTPPLKLRMELPATSSPGPSASAESSVNWMRLRKDW